MKNKRELQIEPHERTIHDFICSWCEEHEYSAEDPKASTLNYGICPACLEARLDESAGASAGAW